jgi:hypothetical protein
MTGMTVVLFFTTQFSPVFLFIFELACIPK